VVPKNDAKWSVESLRWQETGTVTGAERRGGAVARAAGARSTGHGAVSGTIAHQGTLYAIGTKGARAS
jgi:hypothetical protein